MRSRQVSSRAGGRGSRPGRGGGRAAGRGGPAGGPAAAWFGPGGLPAPVVARPGPPVGRRKPLSRAVFRRPAASDSAQTAVRRRRRGTPHSLGSIDRPPLDMVYLRPQDRGGAGRCPGGMGPGQGPRGHPDAPIFYFDRCPLGVRPARRFGCSQSDRPRGGWRGPRTVVTWARRAPPCVRRPPRGCGRARSRRRAPPSASHPSIPAASTSSFLPSHTAPLLAPRWKAPPNRAPCTANPT